ncbi:hypothetical protein BTA51_29545 [Hahella sp. CCB-MM4]|uniref:TolC family protein n=1 Tax=Hahella sp. (strain CCB-MM4) TaxID=1926491 RepID=UPI000B9B5725|nr:TolC family protein [Hahella sp. CCB-MM4]OZG69770.1 hypothetical protein BTA51_29545 [Hahella sp. CCB-MM4]
MYRYQPGKPAHVGRTHYRTAIGGLLLAFSSIGHTALTIEQAQHLAVTSDFGIKKVMHSAEAMKSEAVAGSQLPDPVLILGAQNLPTDSFKFDQEPMTQLKVGIRQMFPKGDSLSLTESKMTWQAEALQDNAKVRYLQVSKMVRDLWLEVMYWQQAQSVLEQDRELFGQLLEVTHSLYSVGRIQQTDVLRAELELSRLDEKLIKAKTSEQKQRAMLARWVGEQAQVETWPLQVPQLTMPATVTSIYRQNATHPAMKDLARALKTHPIVVSMESQVEEAGVDVELAKTQYDPSWGVELSYGYRDGQNQNGSDRSDFFSAVVTVSMPIFSSVKQDKGVQSSNYRYKSRSYAVDDQITQMTGEVAGLIARLKQIDDQLDLFDREIIRKSSQQAEAALAAYQSDASGFGEVMRAYLGEQKDRLDYQRLLIDRLQLISEFQFYFPEQLPELTGIHLTDILFTDLQGDPLK